ncbi:hypothetical protein KCP76_07520 [Salmonella enterica subsp. enterica serovar Weltevreden]|nr:hypothetical protein KCP76_07520 [Salmonella enterica subsp. enterica serovar Weltevreden]
MPPACWFSRFLSRFSDEARLSLMNSAKPDQLLVSPRQRAAKVKMESCKSVFDMPSQRVTQLSCCTTLPRLIRLMQRFAISVGYCARACIRTLGRNEAQFYFARRPVNVKITY